MIRVLHLTDFHLNEKILRDWKSYLKDALLNKLRVIDRKIPIAFVAFTGDLVDVGGDDFKNISTAFEVFKLEVIQPIIDELGVGIERFLIVPGNHDIVRKLDHKRDELGSSSYFKENYANISDYMTNASKANNFNGMNRIKDFKEFEKSLYDGVSDYYYTIFGSSFKFKTEIESVGICCLNSSWRCYDKNDAGKLIVGETQLVEVYNKIKECDIKIALMHHPLDWLIETERTIITNHLSKDFDVLLMGHVHENKTSVETGLTGTLFKNIAPSGLNDIRSDSRTYSNGFTIVDFDKPKKIVSGEYWRYNHDQKIFVANTDLSEDGTFLYEIPSQKSKRNQLLEIELISNIKEDHFPVMDKHLIGTKANSIPISIKEGFILPPINEGITSEEQADEVTDVTLEEIMKTRFNLMFFADQEGGKTTLLLE